MLLIRLTSVKYNAHYYLKTKCADIAYIISIPTYIVIGNLKLFIFLQQVFANKIMIN